MIVRLSRPNAFKEKAKENYGEKAKCDTHVPQAFILGIV
jgi:hypothetical protein